MDDFYGYTREAYEIKATGEVAIAMAGLMADRHTWQGTTTALLSDLKPHLDLVRYRPSATGLGVCLDLIQDWLADDLGLEMTRRRTRSGQVWTFTKGEL